MVAYQALVVLKMSLIQNTLQNLCNCAHYGCTDKGAVLPYVAVPPSLDDSLGGQFSLFTVHPSGLSGGVGCRERNSPLTSRPAERRSSDRLSLVVLGLQNGAAPYYAK